MLSRVGSGLPAAVLSGGLACAHGAEAQPRDADTMMGRAGKTDARYTRYSNHRSLIDIKGCLKRITTPDLAAPINIKSQDTRTHVPKSKTHREMLAARGALAAGIIASGGCGAAEKFSGMHSACGRHCSN